MDDSERKMSSGLFPTTQWTQIIEVMQKGQHDAAWTALARFCEQYRPAVYGFFRRRGCEPQQADDFTQEFFATRIHKRWDDREGFLFKAKKAEGRRFRAFLCHVLWAFLKDQWKAPKANRVHVPIDGLDFSDEETEAKAFAKMSSDMDRQVGLEIIKKAAGNTTRSEHLLAHFRVEISQADAAKALGMKENAFRQAFDRFKKKFPINLRKEVAKIVGPDPKDIEEEIRYLMSIFSQPAA